SLLARTLAPPAWSCTTTEFPVDSRSADRLTRAVLSFKSNSAISASLVFAIFLWGGTNIGVKYMVGSWPPIWVGCSRFLCASLLLLAILHWTDWLGTSTHVSNQLKRSLWWRGG